MVWIVLASNIPGGDYLTTALDVISQSILIPVIIVLLIFAVYSVIAIGGIITEYTTRKNVSINVIKDIVYEITKANSRNEIKDIIDDSELPESQKEILVEINSLDSMNKESREELARKFLENEEYKMKKVLETTDIVTRIGPTLGLMGTLIPMGPGLAALGSGDIETLSNAIIVAFNTTVVGIGSGAITYVVSKIRRRWYDQYLSNLDTLIDCVLSKI